MTINRGRWFKTSFDIMFNGSTIEAFICVAGIQGVVGSRSCKLEARTCSDFRNRFDQSERGRDLQLIISPPHIALQRFVQSLISLLLQDCTSIGKRETGSRGATRPRPLLFFRIASLCVGNISEGRTSQQRHGRHRGQHVGEESEVLPVVWCREVNIGSLSKPAWCSPS